MQIKSEWLTPPSGSEMDSKKRTELVKNETYAFNKVKRVSKWVESGLGDVHAVNPDLPVGEIVRVSKIVGKIAHDVCYSNERFRSAKHRNVPFEHGIRPDDYHTFDFTKIPGLNTLRSTLGKAVDPIMPRDVHHPIATEIIVNRLLGAASTNPLAEYLDKHESILHAMLHEINSDSNEGGIIDILKTADEQFALALIEKDDVEFWHVRYLWKRIVSFATSGNTEAYDCVRDVLLQSRTQVEYMCKLFNRDRMVHRRSRRPRRQTLRPVRRRHRRGTNGISTRRATSNLDPSVRSSRP